MLACAESKHEASEEATSGNPALSAEQLEARIAASELVAAGGEADITLAEEELGTWVRSHATSLSASRKPCWRDCAEPISCCFKRAGRLVLQSQFQGPQPRRRFACVP